LRDFLQPGIEFGRSGSGKVPFLSCYSDYLKSGRILIDGFDIKSADLASLRQQIGGSPGRFSLNSQISL